MWGNLKNISSFSRKANIFVADCPGEQTGAIRSRFINLVNWHLDRSSAPDIRLRPLERRFPLEKDTWTRLLQNAPVYCEELLRNRNSNVLIWIKTDKSCKRLKLDALTSLNRQETLSPCDFSLTELEPLPVEQMGFYAPIISVFVLAQLPVPGCRNKQEFLSYAGKIRTLSPVIDSALATPGTSMPASFRFTLRRLQAWSWFIAGMAFEDTAKLGRAIRACKSLIRDWPPEKSEFEYGQTLANLAALSMEHARLVTGMEALEKTLDNVDEAQAVLGRVKYPSLWASLQELRADAQINLGERYGDTEYFESSIHTLQTIKRIWASGHNTGKLAKIQKRIGSVLHRIGKTIPGTERLEQASSAFYGSAFSYEQAGLRKQEGLVRLELARTLIDLGERSGNSERLEDALAMAWKAEQLLKDRFDRKVALQCSIVRARALTRIGCQHSDRNEADHYLKQAATLLGKVLRQGDRLEFPCRIQSFEFISVALGHLGKIRNSAELLTLSSEYCRQAIELLETEKNRQLLRNAAPDLLGKFHIQLARNEVWLGRKTSKGECLDQAVISYGRALELVDREQTGRDWAVLQSELADTLILAAKHRNGQGADLVDQAIQAYHRSLGTLRRDRAPLLWAQIKSRLAEALALSGAMGGGTPCFELAIESYSRALEEWKPGPGSMERASALNNMANVLADLGRREADTGKLEKARIALSEAYDLYSTLGQTGFAERVHDNLAAISDLVANDFQISASRLFDDTVARP